MRLLLYAVMFMYNTTVNADTTYTPHYFLFGRECNVLPLGPMLGRMEETPGLDEGTRREQKVNKQWKSTLVSVLSAAWEGTMWANDNATRCNWTGRARSI